MDAGGRYRLMTQFRDMHANEQCVTDVVGPVQYTNRLPVPPTQSALYEPEYSPRRLSRELPPRSHPSVEIDPYSSREIGPPFHEEVDTQKPSIIRDNETGQLYELDPNYGNVAPRRGILPSTVAKGYLIAICLVIVGVALYFGITALVLGQDKQQKKEMVQAQMAGKS